MQTSWRKEDGMGTMKSLETRDLDRIRFFTRHFHSLQGLRHMVPLGLITLSAAAFFTEAPLPFLGAVPLLGAVLLILRARFYYASTFGQAEPRQAPRPATAVSGVSIYSSAGPAPWLESSPSPISTMQRTLLLIGLAPTLYLLFQNLIAPPWVTFPSGTTLPRPIEWHGLGTFPALLLYALYGSLFLSIWWLQERRLAQSYHLGLGVLVLGFSALSAPPWAAPLLCGSAMILAGLLDHCRLVRALGSAARESEEDV
jgi:hypothetical protein